MNLENLVNSSKVFMQDFLPKNLPSQLSFHNSNHTFEVLQAVQTIGEQSGITDNELCVVEIAALFHDCGYAEVYAGHEEISKKIATTFLTKYGCPQYLISEINELIESTKFPQSPTTLRAQILCDADLSHFAKSDYHRYAQSLKREQELYLNNPFSEKDWAKKNLDLMINHNYYTDYGLRVLEAFKTINIQMIGGELN